MSPGHPKRFGTTGARLIRGLKTIAAGSAVSKAALIATEFYLAWSLGAAGYGLYSVGLALLLVLSTLSQAGLGFGVIQYIGTSIESGDNAGRDVVIRASLLIVGLVSLSVGALLYWNAQFIASAVFDNEQLTDVLRLCGIMIPLEGLNQNMSAIFRATERYKLHLVAVDGARNGGLLLCFPLALFGGLTLTSAFLVMGVGTAVGTALGLWMLRREITNPLPWSWVLSQFKVLMVFSGPLFLWQVLQKTSNRLSVVIAGTILPASSLGILALAYRFSNILDFPQTVVNSASAVEFVRLNHLHDQRRLGQMFRVLATSLSLIVLAVAAPIVLNRDQIFSHFGNPYASNGWVLAWLFGAKSIEVAAGPVGQVLIACRLRKTVLALATLDSLLQFLLVVPLIWYFGLAGAVFGNSGRSVLTTMVRQMTLYRTVGITPWKGAYCVAIGGGSLVLMLALAAMAQAANPAMVVAVNLGAMLALTLLAVRLIPILRKEFAAFAEWRDTDGKTRMS